MKSRGPRGFSLIELLVTVSIISMLTAILVPVMSSAQRQARRLRGMSNQRQILCGVSLYAMDNDERYPESIATIGPQWYWNWQEPMMLTGYRARSPRLHRAMSTYLWGYIDDAEIMYCPNAPKEYKYRQAAWDAGDEWDNPDTGPVLDPVSGTYCFYWNYTGYLEESEYLFRGPRTTAGGPGQSRLLLGCYFGYDHHRSPGAYGSCEQFDGSFVTEGTLLSSAYWSGRAGAPMPEVKLHGGYIDGHVGTYSARDTTAMRVIWKTETNEPYPEGLGPGKFSVPREDL